MKVRDVMQTEVWTVPATLGIQELGRLLTERRVSGAPVVDDQGHVVGVVSLYDVAAAPQRTVRPTPRWGRFWDAGIVDDDLLDSFSREGFAGQGLVRDIMMPAVYSIDPDASLIELADLLVAHRVHRAIVVEHGRPVGIVTNTDLVRMLRDLLSVTSPAAT